MLKKFTQYTVTTCLASVIALAANAELTVNKAMTPESAMSKKSPITTAKPSKYVPKQFQGVYTKKIDKIGETAKKNFVEKPMVKNPEPIVMPVERKSDSEKIRNNTDRFALPNFRTDWLNDGNNYFKVKAGVVQPMRFGGNSEIENKGSATYVAGVGVGRKIMSSLALEIEYLHRGKSKATYTVLTEDRDFINRRWGVESDMLMLNANTFLVKDSVIQPYIKLGVGLSRNKADGYVREDSGFERYVYKSKSNTAFAWQAGFGLNFEYDKNIASELEYSFVNRGKFMNSHNVTYIKDGNSSERTKVERKGRLRDHAITFGIKLKF